MTDAEQAGWDCVDDAVGRLEQAWRESDQVELDRFVPPPEHPSRRQALVALAAIDQEHRWERGRPKRLEAYLDQWPELAGDREAQIELLDAECRTRAALGDPLTPEELRQRFPSLAGEIDLDEIAAEARSESDATPAASENPTIVPPSPGAADQAPHALRIGQRFGRYEIRDLLGSGGMATVYRAYDVQLRREVALKIPHFHPQDRPGEIERFVREAQLAATLRHRNVCRVYDAGQIDGVHFITMELIEGDPLDTEIRKKGPMEPRQAAELVAKLARALQSMHQAGIIHRDVKASNVMIDIASGEPYLMDFGLAWQSRFDNLLTDARARVGTPATMSPEQVTGKAVDARSDVYSLGVLLYQMLTGRLPIEGTLADIVERIAHQPPPPPRQFRPELDPELEAICLKALSKHPADRYPSAGELAENLQQYLRRPPAKSRGPGWPRRRIATITALVLVLGAILYLKTGSGMLVLDVTPRDAKVAIDGSAVAPGDYPAQLPLSVGYHRVTIARAGYEDVAREVAVSYRGAQLTLKIHLSSSDQSQPETTPATPGPSTGTLVLDIGLLQRRGVVVTIDGRPRSIASWPATIVLEPGTHRLEVSARRYRTHSEELKITAGQTVRRDLRLDRDSLQREPIGLVRRTGKALVDDLRGLLGNRSEDAGARLGDLLAGIGPEDAARATAELQKALSSEDPAVRRRAAEGLGQLGPAAKQAVPSLEKCLKDDDPAVRAAATRSLEAIRQ